MHEFTGIEIHPAMAMSARPPKCVSNGGRKAFNFPSVPRWPSPQIVCLAGMVWDEFWFEAARKIKCLAAAIRNAL